VFQQKTYSKGLIITLVAFASMYALISFVNHYLFRTYALDLGLYTNAMQRYISGMAPDTKMFWAPSQHMLADHFDLYLVLFSPLKFIFGTYTLLIVQWIALMVGGLGIYKYVQKHINPQFALPAILCFYAYFGLFSAIAYDYHSNVVAAMAVPWLLFMFKEEKFKWVALLTLFILIGKENMGLWTFFIFTALALQNWKNKTHRIWAIGLAGFSLVYFLVVIQVFMPAMSPNGKYHGFHFSALGLSLSDAVKHLFLHPIDSLKMLFTNQHNMAEADGFKAEFYTFFLLSGSYLLLRKPLYLIMLIPLIGQKMFHDNIALWGVHFQYSVEFAPIVVIGGFTAIQSIRQSTVQKVLVGLILLGTFGTTIRLMDRTVQFSDKSKIRFYKADHYKRNFDVSFVHDKLNALPDNGIVSAHSSLVPHLTLRDRVYQFPIVLDANIILVHASEGPWPLASWEVFHEEVESYKTSPEWSVLCDENGLLILERQD
jgi:uncharacterized membrane protein